MLGIDRHKIIFYSNNYLIFLRIKFIIYISASGIPNRDSAIELAESTG